MNLFSEELKKSAVRHGTSRAGCGRAERAALDRLNVMRSRRKRTLIGIFPADMFCFGRRGRSNPCHTPSTRAQERLSARTHLSILFHLTPLA